MDAPFCLVNLPLQNFIVSNNSNPQLAAQIQNFPTIKTDFRVSLC